MFKVLSALLVGLLLQLDSAKGQPTLQLPNVVLADEGETFSACFGVDNPPDGGDFVVNVMANPGALPKLTIGFSQPSYTFVENTTQNQVCVNISNGTIAGGIVALTATIVYETDMTAAMSDITPGNLMVTFTENTGSEVCVVLGVNEDGEFEGAETLIVRLVSADNPLMIDSTMDLATITILDIEANCGPPPMGDGVTPTLLGFFVIAALSSPPTITVNPGGVVDYTCEASNTDLIGESRLTCTLVDATLVNATAMWVPDVAPSCSATAGAPSTYSSVVMLMTVTGLCLGRTIHS